MQIRKLVIGALFGIALIAISQTTVSAQRYYRDWGNDRSSQTWDGYRYSGRDWDSGRRYRAGRYRQNSRWRYERPWYSSNRRYRRQQYWNYVRWRRQQYWNNRRRAARQRALRYRYYRNY